MAELLPTKIAEEPLAFISVYQRLRKHYIASTMIAVELSRPDSLTAAMTSLSATDFS
jgi:hypothetical protein